MEPGEAGQVLQVVGILVCDGPGGVEGRGGRGGRRGGESGRKRLGAAQFYVDGRSGGPSLGLVVRV